MSMVFIDNVGSLSSENSVLSLHTYGVETFGSRGIKIEGHKLVVSGGSNIVGKPTALMLMPRDATVCICHRRPVIWPQFTFWPTFLL